MTPPPNLKLKEVGEFGLIERLSGIMQETLAAGVRGEGDDCAVVPFGDTSLVVTTDTMVENRHFSWEFTSAYDLGWKLLAVNLSDIAAAGARPLTAVVTLQLRAEMETAIIEEIYRGAAALAKKHGVSLAGGDTTSSSVVAFGVTIIGEAKKPLSRAGAKAGDDLWVSGTIGLGGLGLALARNEISPSDFPDFAKEAQEKYCRPVPRVELGRILLERNLVTAAIDISDGLVQDGGHLARRSGLSLEIELDRVPTGAPPEKWSILRSATSGDDYELLFTSAVQFRQELESIPGLSRIGRSLERDDAAVYLVVDGAPQPSEKILQQAGLSSGFDHFQRPAQ